MRLFIPHKANYNGSEMYTIPLPIGLNCCIKTTAINNIGNEVIFQLLTNKMFNQIYGEDFTIPAGVAEASMTLISASVEHTRGKGILHINVFDNKGNCTDKFIIEFQYVEIEV